jgi:hypothetical protein
MELLARLTRFRSERVGGLQKHPQHDWNARRALGEILRELGGEADLVIDGEWARLVRT